MWAFSPIDFNVRDQKQGLFDMSAVCKSVVCIFPPPIFEREQELASILELFLQLITAHFNKRTSLSRNKNRVVKTTFVPVTYNEHFSFLF